MDMDFQWGSASDDTQVISIIEGILDKAITLAEQRKLFNRYIYQNYAYVTQDVFSGYGQKNKERLIRIQRAYDPKGVMLDLQPGYFKLRS